MAKNDRNHHTKFKCIVVVIVVAVIVVIIAFVVFVVVGVVYVIVVVAVDVVAVVVTVELRSKGPGRKGNPPIREIILGPIGYFPIYFYIGYKGILFCGKKIRPIP